MNGEMVKMVAVKLKAQKQAMKKSTQQYKNDLWMRDQKELPISAPMIQSETLDGWTA